MALRNERLMGAVSTVLRVLVILNIICLFFFLAILLGSIVAEPAIVETLLKNHPARDPARVLLALRTVMLLGLIAVPLAHILLMRLRQMVETVRAGDPFVAANASRLATIAWCLLGLQLCDLGFGVVSLTFASAVEAVSGWTFSLTGWLAVALLFVLARVFTHGTRMREELEGTV
jgi:hypothetical protein